MRQEVYSPKHELTLYSSRGGGGGGSQFHMLGVRGCAAHQGILFEDICSLRVYFVANFSCLCSLGYAFQPHSKLCVPSGYTISRFLIVFYVLSGSMSSIPSGTTPSILPPPSMMQYLKYHRLTHRGCRFNNNLTKTCCLLIS